MAIEVEAGAYMNQVDGIFSHNPLHDLESLWWVGVWFLLCHYEPSNIRDITVQKHFEVVKKYGETLFNNRRGDNPLSRRHALTSAVLLANIKPRSFCIGVQHLILLLDLFRDQLVVHYKKYKPTTTSQDLSFFYPEVHLIFAGIVDKIMKEIGNDESELWLVGLIEKNIAFYNSQK